MEEQLGKLFSAAHDDAELLKLISDCVNSFEEYHRAIFDMESWLKLYNSKNLTQEDYQYQMIELSKRRTNSHNAVLASVNILNRVAAQHGLPPVYDGEVSEKQPYRREVADAVLGYIENVIRKRR